MTTTKTSKSKKKSKSSSKTSTRTVKPVVRASKVQAKAGSTKRLSAKSRSPEEQLLAQLSTDCQKLLEEFIQRQYADLSDFASDIVVATAKRLLENQKS